MGGGGDSTTTTQNYSPEEAARRAKLMAEAERIYGMVGGKMASSPYPGAKPVGFDPMTLAGQNLLAGNAMQGIGASNALNQGVQYGMTGAMDVNNNPYLQNAISAALNPLTKSFSDAGGVMSTIRSGAQGAGQYGGTRQGIAEGIASGRYAQQVGDTASQMASDAYNKGQDTFQKTLAFAPQAMQASTLPAQWLSAIGAQNEGLNREINQYNADSRMWDLNAPWLPLQNYANIIYGGGSSQASSTMSGGGSGATGALGGAAGGAGLAAALGATGPYGMAIGAILGALMGTM